jgi:signal transduction histidine kinase
VSGLKPRFALRLLWVLLALLLGWGALVALTFHHQAAEREAKVLQEVSRGLAAHIVAHWPQMGNADPAANEKAARQAVLQMLTVVNPGVQAYVLDADGTVAEYLGEPGMVQSPRVDLGPVNRFLSGHALPLRGSDPMAPQSKAITANKPSRLFSAAMFASRTGDTRPPGYLYLVLDGRARQQAALAVGDTPAWASAAAVALVGLLLATLIAAYALLRLSRPLHRLAQRMHGYQLGLSGQAAPLAAPRGDEVKLLGQAFEQMTQRIEAHAERERAQTAAQRETLASIAHDLRTPLTALHGHLEALLQPGTTPKHDPKLLLRAALAQSDKVRALSRQLFELASLQLATEVPQRERFRIDELVADSVGKFRLMQSSAGNPMQPEVQLTGLDPGALEVEGDLQLVERAITNLIDNARQHGQGPGPVTVSLAAVDGVVQVRVQDHGPGLPHDLQQRLQGGQSLREPPLKRASGGIGGLGLAIAQRVAVLHGGSLRPLPAPEGGACLCLVLPRAQ